MSYGVPWCLVRPVLVITCCTTSVKQPFCVTLSASVRHMHIFWHILHNSGEAVVHPRLKYYDCVARRYRLRFGTVHQCANFYAFHKSWRGLTSPFPQPPSTGLSSKRCLKSVAWAAVTVRLGICAQATWLWLLQCSWCWGRFESSYFTFSSVCVFSVIMKWWMARSFNF